MDDVGKNVFAIAIIGLLLMMATHNIFNKEFSITYGSLIGYITLRKSAQSLGSSQSFLK